MYEVHMCFKDRFLREIFNINFHTSYQKIFIVLLKKKKELQLILTQWHLKLKSIYIFVLHTGHFADA